MPVDPTVKNLFPALGKLAPGPFQALADVAEDWLIQYLGRQISPGTYTETFSGNNQAVIYLSNTPVTSITSVTVNGVALDASDNTWNYTSSGKLVKNSKTFWNQNFGWTPGTGNIVVTYVCEGLSQTRQNLLIGTVMNWFLDAQKRSSLVSSESIGDYSYVMNSAFNKGVPTAVSVVLNPYRNNYAAG